jgi:hypothetical protein
MDVLTDEVLSQIDPLYVLPFHFSKIHFNIILPYTPGSSSWSFPQVSRPKPCMHLSSSHPTTCFAHLSLLGFITRIIIREPYRAQSSSLGSLLHSPVISSLLDPNILLSTLFLKNLSLHSSLSVSDQVSHPYKSRDKSIFLCISVPTFLDSKLEDKRLFTELQQAFPDFTILLIYSRMGFYFVNFVAIIFCIEVVPFPFLLCL